MRIEKGIREVQYKTKDGTQIKYRVRIKRKGFEADRLFDTLKEARDFVSLAASDDGQKALTQHSEVQRLAAEAMTAYLASPPLEVYLSQYFLRYVKNEETETKSRSTAAATSRLKTICKTMVKVNPKELSGLVAMLKQHAKGNELIALGKIKLEDINEQVATDYIVERCKAAAKSTVKREAALLQSFFNKLRYLDNATWKRLKSNPFQDADRSLLKNASIKRKRRLEDGEEKALFESLFSCQNPEMAQIVAIALTTGLRRGEILELKWVDVGKHLITVRNSKSGDREAVISEEARVVLDSIKRVDAKVFHYTADGFASNWDRVKKRAKIENLRFHDMRREFISRLVDLVSNPMAIAEMTSLKDVNHIQRQYIDPAMAEKNAKAGIRTESELLKSVGHKSRTTTAGYYTRKGSK